MATINSLTSLTTLTANDLLAIWDSNAGSGEEPTKKIAIGDLGIIVSITELHASIGANSINAVRTGGIIAVSGYFHIDSDISAQQILFKINNTPLSTYSVITRYTNNGSFSVSIDSNGYVLSNTSLNADTYYLNMILPAN